jgi:heat-inducible transcriptional repressor
MTQDVPALPELTKRQEDILSLIIRAYSQKPEPVGSKVLVEMYDLNFSAATMRNEMAVLEELGYLASPHTSAGRVPTDKGYRYFITHILSNGDLSLNEQRGIAEKLGAPPLGTEQWMRLAATILARTSHAASLVTPPAAQIGRYKHLELIAIQGRLVLMVLVMHDGLVQQRMLTLPEPLAQTTLSDAASRLNTLLADLTAKEIRLKAVPLPALEREVAELVAEAIERSRTFQNAAIYRDGLGEVINAFTAADGAQQMVRIFEERAVLNMILDEFLSPLVEDVQVIIGGEGREELSQVSIILSRYGLPGQMTGAVGLLGPTHINYGRAISTVRYVSSMMTNILVGLYGEGDEGRFSAD